MTAIIVRFSPTKPPNKRKSSVDLQSNGKKCKTEEEDQEDTTTLSENIAEKISVKDNTNTSQSTDTGTQSPATVK